MEEKNRFTDINKWNDPWFQELTNEQKIMWLYMQDVCSPIGIYRHNVREVKFKTMMEEESIPSLEAFNEKAEKIVLLQHLGKDVYLIKDYIRFQYSGKKGNGLSVASAPHYGYLNEIRYRNLWEYFLSTSPDLISNKSIVYFYAVDEDEIENTKKPTKRVLEELPYSIKDVPDWYKNPSFDSTLPLDKVSYTIKEKDKEKEQVKAKDKAKKKDQESSKYEIRQDKEFRELVKYLNTVLPSSETSIHTFEAELQMLIEELEEHVAMPLNTIKLTAIALAKEKIKKKRSLSDIKGSLQEEYGDSITPF